MTEPTTAASIISAYQPGHARTTGLECITQDAKEAAIAPDYVSICTIRADLMACSVHCAGTGCGGHPICRPCYTLGVERGLIVEVEGA